MWKVIIILLIILSGGMVAGGFWYWEVNVFGAICGFAGFFFAAWLIHSTEKEKVVRGLPEDLFEGMDWILSFIRVNYGPEKADSYRAELMRLNREILRGQVKAEAEAGKKSAMHIHYTDPHNSTANVDWEEEEETEKQRNGRLIREANIAAAKKKSAQAAEAE